MTAVAERPKVSKRSDPQNENSFWVWESWPLSIQFQNIIIAETGIEGLCGAAGGWTNLKAALASKGQLPDAILAEMRRLMDIFEYNPECPWDLPEQPWVDEQVRAFCKWYVDGHGEPEFEAASAPTSPPVAISDVEQIVPGQKIQDVQRPKKPAR